MSGKKPMPYERAARAWKKDAKTLGKLGFALLHVPLPAIEVQIPRKLAKKAARAWEADYRNVEDHRESRRESALRRNAATLALIGLAITEHGDWREEGVLVSLDSTQIARAVDASDDYPAPKRRKDVAPPEPPWLPHACKVMRVCVDDPRVQIGYSPTTREYWIQLLDSAAVQGIEWCPFCGDKLPASLRDEYFEELDKLGLELGDPKPARLADDSWWRGRA